jgi:hypothetical protein
MHFEGHPKIMQKKNVAGSSLCPFPLCMAFGVQEGKRGKRVHESHLLFSPSLGHESGNDLSWTTNPNPIDIIRSPNT